MDQQSDFSVLVGKDRVAEMLFPLPCPGQGKQAQFASQHLPRCAAIEAAEPFASPNISSSTQKRASAHITALAHRGAVPRKTAQCQWHRGAPVPNAQHSAPPAPALPLKSLSTTAHPWVAGVTHGALFPLHLFLAVFPQTEALSYIAALKG